MIGEKLICLWCGKETEERQCPICRRKSLVQKDAYQRGVQAAKDVIRGLPPSVPPFQGLGDVFTVLSETFPNPFLPAKILVQIIHQAQRELAEEKERRF